jgi:hypothetical protein
LPTVASITLNRTRPKARIAIPIDPMDYWDDTNKRFKSGCLKIQVTAVTDSISGRGGSEKPTLVVRPPNYNPACHDEYRRTDGTIALAADYFHYLAVNYGVPGPSAVMGADGIGEALCVEVELEPDTTGSGTFSVTYTATFTEVSPYAALSSPNCSGTASLTLVEGQESAWSMITMSPTGEDVTDGYVAIQLSTLSSTVRPGALPDNPPSIEVASAGAGDPLFQSPLSLSDTFSRSFSRFYTRVFAINASKVDANGTTVQVPVDSASVLNLFNVGLKNVREKDQYADIDLAYLGKTANL